VTRPLEQAAVNAWAEVDGLADAAALALVLADSPASYLAAKDAVNAWRRASRRAVDAQRLADHDGGAYNAWDDDCATPGGAR
jgi:hypothetical protein